jgi:hypothetical protein
MSGAVTPTRSSGVSHVDTLDDDFVLTREWQPNRALHDDPELEQAYTEMYDAHLEMLRDQALQTDEQMAAVNQAVDEMWDAFDAALPTDRFDCRPTRIEIAARRTIVDVDDDDDDDDDCDDNHTAPTAAAAAGAPSARTKKLSADTSLAAMADKLGPVFTYAQVVSVKDNPFHYEPMLRNDAALAAISAELRTKVRCANRVPLAQFRAHLRRYGCVVSLVRDESIAQHLVIIAQVHGIVCVYCALHEFEDENVTLDGYVFVTVFERV